MIASGRYPRGQKLPPRRSCQAVRGQPQHLREAVNQLSAMGLLSSQQGVARWSNHRPPRVPELLEREVLLDSLSVREFIEARICIERNAVRLAVARAGAEECRAPADDLEHQRRH